MTNQVEIEVPDRIRKEKAALATVNLSDIFKVRRIYGYDGTLRNNLFAIPSETSRNTERIIYTAGHTIIIYNLEKEEQIYIHGTEGAKRITCMTISKKYRYLAIAEEAETAIITVYDLNGGKDKDELKPKKKKVLVTTDAQSKEYAYLSFSSQNESKYLAAMTTNDKIIIWEWSKGKAKTSFFAQNFADIKGMFFHPNEEYIFVIGSGAQGGQPLRFYQINYDKNQVNVTPKSDLKKEYQSYTSILSYCFVEDEVIFGTDQGRIYSMNKNYEFRTWLATSPVGELEITALCPTSTGDGFIASGNSCKFITYERNEKDPKNPYIRTERKITNKALENIGVNCMVHQNEDFLIAGLVNGSLYQVQLSTEKVKPQDNYGFRALIENFHTDYITGISLCFMKPLAVTCSKDKHIKIWNFELNKLELDQIFEDEVNAVSFHPSGYHISAAFTSKVKMFNVQLERLQDHKEISEKNIFSLEYSNSGQFLAIAKSQNISIISVYTGQILNNLNIRAHSSDIVKIIWHPNDLGLFSLGKDGQLNEWQLETPHQKFPIMNENTIGESFDFIQNEKKDIDVYACSTDNYIIKATNEKIESKAFHDKDLSLEGHNFQIPTPENIPSGSKICSIKFSHTGLLLLIGTGQKGSDMPGILRAYRYPFTGDVGEIQLHNKSITSIAVSHDDSKIFTIGEDNVLTILDIDDMETRSAREKNLISMPFALEHLYDKNDYSEKVNQIKDLEKQLHETKERAKRKNEETMRRKEKERNELDERLRIMRGVEESNLERLKRETQQMELMYEDQIKQVKQEHERKKTEIQMKKHKQIADEEDKINMKKEEKLLLEKEEKSRLEEYSKSKDLELQDMKQNHSRMLDREVDERRKIVQTKQDIEESHALKIEAIEDEAARKIEEMKERFEKTTKALNEENDAKQCILKNAIDECAKKVNDKLEEEEKIKKIEEEINHFSDKIATESKKKSTQENDIKERDTTIEKKNERINELMRKTQELEKFKFVLDYKIKELRRDIGPREEEISKMKEQIEVMNNELDEFKKSNDHLNLFVNDFNLKLNGKESLNIRNQKGDYQEKV